MNLVYEVNLDGRVSYLGIPLALLLAVTRVTMHKNASGTIKHTHKHQFREAQKCRIQFFCFSLFRVVNLVQSLRFRAAITFLLEFLPFCTRTKSDISGRHETMKDTSLQAHPKKNPVKSLPTRNTSSRAAQATPPRHHRPHATVAAHAAVPRLD